MLIDDTNPDRARLASVLHLLALSPGRTRKEREDRVVLVQTRSCRSCNRECTLPPSSKAHVCSVRFQRLSSARSQGDRGRQKWGRRQRLCKSVGISNLGYRIETTPSSFFEPRSTVQRPPKAESGFCVSASAFEQKPTEREMHA